MFRFLTGAGIGGEYTAINSTIQEFVPARYRGWTDLVINGSFWIGAALGAGGAIVLLNPSVIAPELGWRVAFFIGAALGLVILLMRLWLPESPRWLVIHGRATEADRILDDIETQIEQHGAKLSPPQRQPMQIQPRSHTPLRELAHALLHTHRRRTMLGLALMIAQAFFYNAIFFTYALVLTRFQGVRSEDVGWYILPFAAGNVLGPLLLGRLFDTLGRRIMITATYGISGLLLAVVALLFARGDLGAAGMTAGWTLVFFFASPAASAAYLTVRESFPLEVRALAIPARAPDRDWRAQQRSLRLSRWRCPDARGCSGRLAARPCRRAPLARGGCRTAVLALTTFCHPHGRRDRVRESGCGQGGHDHAEMDPTQGPHGARLRTRPRELPRNRGTPDEQNR